MQDTQLITKLAAREMFAIEAKYQCVCLHVKVSTQHMLEAAVKPKPAPMTKSSAKSGSRLFKLSSLHDLYVSCQSL